MYTFDWFRAGWLPCMLAMLALVILGAGNVARAQNPARSPRTANYHIQVSLDPDQKMLSGTERLHWVNPSSDTIWRMPFHLYLNAFKHTRSTFMKEARGQFWFMLIDESDSTTWGGIDIDRISLPGGPNLMDRTAFIQPDDGNPDDETVLELILPEPLPPGAAIDLDIAFSARIPKIIARTGYGDDYFFIAQWYPKVGVYEPAGTRYATTGQWNCHQFHATTEFYADFGLYDVEITLPERFTVGASGALIRETNPKAGQKTLHYRAEDVTDFAWTASPFFREVNDTWKGVAIRLLIQPEHEMHTDRYLESVKYAFEYFDTYIGPYPYPSLTIVDPPIYGIGSSGMEYPTLFTGGSFYGLPRGIRSVELLTVHEFGHQYFMQVLATNEMEEPWMDEGFNRYWENRVMDHYYGEKTSSFELPGMHRGGAEGSRLAYTGMKYPQIAPNYGVPWQSPDPGAYFTLTYNKTATWLATLEGLLGRQTMDRIFQRYYQQWQFRHPCARDFIAVVKEIVDEAHGPEMAAEMDDFFARVLYGTHTCDYELVSIENVEESESFESSVLIINRGNMHIPVEVRVRFEDGSEERRHWDGKSRTHTLHFSGTKKVVSAHIDPEGKNRMDLNLNNNSLTIEPDTRPAWKYGVLITHWMQQLMLLLSALM